MDEIKPAVFDVELPCLFLRTSLLEKDQVAAIVEFPGVAALRKLCASGERRARRVLTQARSVYDQRRRREADSRAHRYRSAALPVDTPLAWMEPVVREYARFHQDAPCYDR